VKNHLKRLSRLRHGNMLSLGSVLQEVRHLVIDDTFLVLTPFQLWWRPASCLLLFTKSIGQSTSKRCRIITMNNYSQPLFPPHVLIIVQSFSSASDNRLLLCILQQPTKITSNCTKSSGMVSAEASNIFPVKEPVVSFL
jgi:hypothetical protein